MDLMDTDEEGLAAKRRRRREEEEGVGAPLKGGLLRSVLRRLWPRVHPRRIPEVGSASSDVDEASCLVVGPIVRRSGSNCGLVNACGGP